MGKGSDLEYFLRRLDASFDAQVVRAEDEAAADLAFSLRQDRTLRQHIERVPCDVWIGDGWQRVTSLGPDVIHVGEPLRVLIPLGHAALRSGAGDIPKPGRAWLPTLRGLARRARLVEVVTTSGVTAAGRLMAAAPDHLLVDGPRGWAAVGVAGVREVRLVRGG